MILINKRRYKIRSWSSLKVYEFEEVFRLQNRLEQIQGKEEDTEEKKLEDLLKASLIVYKQVNIFLNKDLPFEGLKLESLLEIQEAVFQVIGDFNNFFDLIKPSKNLFYKFRFWNIESLENTSLIRSFYLDNTGASLTGASEGKLELSLFLAQLLRRKGERRETALKKGFISSKALTLQEDRILEEYLYKFKTITEKRSKLFKGLKLSKALSLYKYYFSLREGLFKQFSKDYSNSFLPEKVKQYYNTFGLLASVEDLAKETGNKESSIFLNSVSSFHKEINRINKKINALKELEK